MESYLLEIENDIEDNILGLLKIIPKEKIKITKINKSILEDKKLDKENLYEELSKIDNPWEFLRKAAGIIDGPEDSSVEHDHYIRGTDKKHNKS